MDATARDRLVRAVSFGLVGGLLVASLLLLVLAWRNAGQMTPECPPETMVECTTVQEGLRAVVRYQVLSGVALGVIAVGGYLFLRLSDRRP